MSQTYTVTLRLDEMVFARAAIAAQIDRFRAKGAQATGGADMYTSAILTLQAALETFDEVLPPR